METATEDKGVRYWVGWYQPTEDYRPMMYPPNEHILGWWCSGQRFSDDAWMVVAVVEADGEEGVEAAILEDWPEVEEWNFITEQGSNFVPGDRFPLSDWMVERFGAVAAEG